MSSPRLEQVRRWRDRLRTLDPAPLAAPLSPEGARLALGVALDALGDSVLAEVAAIEAPQYETAAMAVARTVPTAPVEWCAVLLGRGTSVVLKHPSGAPGLTPLLVQAAAEVGLPLSATDDRDVLRDAELVIAMGTDETIATIEATSRARRKLLFGARFSVAWVGERVGERASLAAAAAAVAEDAALHDGRGCMSPSALLTPLPLDEVVDALAEAMATMEQRVPRGAVTPWEAAKVRERRALARVLGRVAEGPGWGVHALPADRFSPTALPRVLAVHQVQDPLEFLAPWTGQISTVGADQPDLVVPGARVVPLGTMQKPPLVRLHDGVDWLRA